jgi:hypothetical protein
MRHPIALTLAIALGAAASTFSTDAGAAERFVRVGHPVRTFAPRFVAGVAAPSFYYGPAWLYGTGNYFAPYYGFHRRYFGYVHRGYGYRGWGFRRR